MVTNVLANFVTSEEVDTLIDNVLVALYCFKLLGYVLYGEVIAKNKLLSMRMFYTCAVPIIGSSHTRKIPLLLRSRIT